MPRRSRRSGRQSTTSPRTSKRKQQTLGELIARSRPSGAAAVFTHSSWARDRASPTSGWSSSATRVLELAIAHTLYERFPDFEEGQMAKLRSHVVSRASCAVVAKELGLGERLLESRPAPRAEELTRLVANRNVLAAVLEAALAAIYLEHGFEAVAGPIVEAFDAPDRVRAHATRSTTRPSSRRARPPGRVRRYALLEAEGPAARAHVHGGRGHRRRRGRHRQGRVEEGRRAGRGARGTRPARPDGERRPARRAASLETPHIRREGAFRVRPAADFPRVHLKTIKLRGFKSFVDPVEVASSPASRSSSGRTAPASRTSPTRSSGRRAR